MPAARHGRDRRGIRQNARMTEPALNLSPSPGDEVKSTTCVGALARGAQRREGRRM